VSRPRWSALLQAEFDEIQSDREALVWAVGCAWGMSVEPYISKARPFLTCSLMLLGMYLTMHHLLAHLSWYGLSPSHVTYANGAAREFLKLAVFLATMALICIVAPGKPRRKVIAAVAFPLFAMMTLEASAAGFEVVHTLTSAFVLPRLELIVRAALFGTIVATVVSLPFALLYRSHAASVACLALIPALAKSLSEVQPSVYTLNRLLEQVAPYACSLLLIAFFSSTCHQWVRHRPAGHD
jgi:lysylphosphatidylglycerol synthetase-like protein (DUF2156 family)